MLPADVGKKTRAAYSGATVINKNGHPIAIYTRIDYDLAGPLDGFIAVDKDNLTAWKPICRRLFDFEQVKDSENPKYLESGDPFIFTHCDEIYMIAGAVGPKTETYMGPRENQGTICLYRAQSDDCLSWDYLGVLFRHPTGLPYPVPTFSELVIIGY